MAKNCGRDYRMKVSVLVTTYNHENFIAQAIESILMQKTDFDFEILIGEDDSEDQTRTIVKNYKIRHPDRIKIFLNDRKNVIYYNGKPTGKWNFLNLLINARGKYIALCEGDDYWIDPFKLQKQVAFLDGHPECAICFHNVRIALEDGKQKSFNHHLYGQKEIFTLEDLLRGNFIHTCSVLFRRGLFNDFPQWYYECQMGDWPLHVLNAQHGHIGFINTAMAVYRDHGAGICSSQHELEVKINSICAARKIRQSLNDKQKRILNQAITLWYEQLFINTKNIFEKREFDRASFWAKKCFSRFLNHREIPKEMLIHFFLIGYLPRFRELIIKKGRVIKKYLRF